MPTGKIGVYTRFFEYANFRLLLSTFLVNMLKHYRIHISQLSIIGAAKVSHFEIMCRVHGFEPTVGLFRCFYVNSKNKGWMSFRMSRNYTLDENTYPQFLRDNDEEIDLFSFIRTADPTKVGIGELEASADKLFDEGGSGRQKKWKTATVDAGEPSYPVKRLRDDHETPSGTSVGGKSQSAIQRLLVGAVRNVEVRGEAIPTLPFVTSSVSATLEREGEGHTDFVTGPNLQAISGPQRFIISSDSSHHSSDNIVEAEVDSFARPSVPVITAATTITPTDGPATVVKEKIVKPSLFFADSTSAGTDPATGGFANLSGSDFLIGGISTVISPDTDLQKVYVPQWSVTNGSRLDDGRVCREIVDEFAPPSFLHQFAEAEATEAIRLRAEASNLEMAEKSLRDEVNALNERNSILEKDRNALDVKVTDLEAIVVSKERELTNSTAQLTSIKSQNDNLADQ
nr:transposase (putative), gypsy type [Tanacetum cinerariifolium]